MKHTKWLLDPTHSVLGFKIKHLMITNVSGSFKNFQAEVETEDEDFSKRDEAHQPFVPQGDEANMCDARDDAMKT